MIGYYLAGAALSWPVLTLVLATRLGQLRRGPSWSTVVTLAGVLALVWPAALVLAYLAPTGGRP